MNSELNLTGKCKSVLSFLCTVFLFLGMEYSLD